MKLVSDAYREVGKTLINIGQGVFIAMLLALLLKEVAFIVLIGFVFILNDHYQERKSSRQ